jgi:hypothetical protein
MAILLEPSLHFPRTFPSSGYYEINAGAGYIFHKLCTASPALMLVQPLMKVSVLTDTEIMFCMAKRNLEMQ